jgi:hypothetical protein
MSTVDDAARPCIAVLIAEYLIEGKRSPDRVFQRVGTLLADAVRRDLMLLKGLCDCVREVAPASARGNRAFILKGTQIFLSAFVDSERGPFRSKPVTGFDKGEGAVSLLIRHGFGQVPTTEDPRDSAGTSLLEFSPRYDHAYLVLGRCLVALGVTPDEPEPDDRAS